MSTERVNRNFQKFLQTIYHWPTSTIDKRTLIEKLEELCRQNPELEHIYENVPISSRNDSTPNPNTVDHSLIRATTIHRIPPIIPNDSRQSLNTDHHTSMNEASIAMNESDPSPNMILVKEGELTVRKGSTVLSSLLKKNRLKTSVYCELSYTVSEGQKLVYLIIYQTRKCRKMVYNFAIDRTCSFVLENKRDFKFKHNSNVEKFATETGIADAWISSFDDVTMIRRTTNAEDVYENPEEFFSTSGSSSFESTFETPARPPPRLILPTNPISPEKIYVCLYDHYPSTNHSGELEFNCGDLLYIVNTDGPEFYVGHRLIFPLNNDNHHPKGLVFKDYIAPAYEKAL